MERALPTFCPIYWRPIEQRLFGTVLLFLRNFNLFYCALYYQFYWQMTDVTRTVAIIRLFKVIAADGLQTNNVVKRHRHHNHEQLDGFSNYINHFACPTLSCVSVCLA
jgi:hypothetical protein